MAITENAHSYSERMQNFISDPEIANLDKKYKPYLELHKIDDLLNVFDIQQNPSNEAIIVKLIWNTDYDYPTELKKDILKLFNRHFTNQD